MQPYQHLYLHGFASGPSSRKALHTARILAECGVALDIPDLNTPNFEHMTLSSMLQLIEQRLRPPAVIWGSSLGGYLATLLASRHPKDVQRLVLMAPAVDFPSRYLKQSAEGQKAWEAGHSVPVYHHAQGRELPLSGDLRQDCTQWPNLIPIDCPALVVAGSRDDVIPVSVVEGWARAQPLAEFAVVDDSHELLETLPQILARALEFLGLRG